MGSESGFGSHRDPSRQDMKIRPGPSARNGDLGHRHEKRNCLSPEKGELIMLTTSTRLKLQDICSRLAQGQFVSLQERVYLQKFAERDRSVSTWVNRAQRFPREGAQHGLDGLIADLDLGRRHPEDPEHPEDDLGDWFSNASPWLRRD